MSRCIDWMTESHYHDVLMDILCNQSKCAVQPWKFPVRNPQKFVTNSKGFVCTRTPITFRQSTSDCLLPFSLRTTNMSSTMNFNPWNVSKEYQKCIFQTVNHENITNCLSLSVQYWHPCQYHRFKMSGIVL
jgi:hypothetical protein